MSQHGRSSTATHKRMRDKTRRAAQDAGQASCPLCGRWLDWTRAGQPNSAEADEITPYALTGQTSTDPANWRIICRHCNQRRGATLGNQRRQRPDKHILTTSTPW